jgi:hypothetical protein
MHKESSNFQFLQSPKFSEMSSELIKIKLLQLASIPGYSVTTECNFQNATNSEIPMYTPFSFYCGFHCIVVHVFAVTSTDVKLVLYNMKQPAAILVLPVFYQNLSVSAILVQILVNTSIPVSSRIFQYLQY